MNSSEDGRLPLLHRVGLSKMRCFLLAQLFFLLLL